MRFALAVSDAYQAVLEAFLTGGWSLEKLFIAPGDWTSSNEYVTKRAIELGVEIQQSPITGKDLADLGRRGCQALVVASYPWKIPDCSADLKYAVNFHPSPLPEGRGPYPLVRAILENRSQWAITCHQINERFDEGNILDLEKFPVNGDESHETLRLKTQMAAGRLAARVAARLESLWEGAVPQEAGTYWKIWSEQDRTIDFNQSIETIMRQIRAFGDFECMATVNDVKIFIHRAKAWVETHSARPGAVVHANNLALVIAASDGLIAITEWSFSAPGATTANLRR